jgi:hypothetical protein
MTQISLETLDKLLIKPVDIVTENSQADLEEAKMAATAKVREIYPDAMLLAWYVSKTGEFRPRVNCDFGQKPAWLVYAESRGADLTIRVNQGAYIFIYNTDPTQAAA